MGKSSAFFRYRLKKKDLKSAEIQKSATLKTSKQEERQKFQSIFQQDQFKAQNVVFLPPETFGEGSSFGDSDPELDFAQAGGWDVATRYHEFKAQKKLTSAQIRALRRVSASAVLSRAREVLNSVTRPSSIFSAPQSEVPAGAESVEIDLEETIDTNLLLLNSKRERSLGASPEVWMSYQSKFTQPLVLCVDTSLSMTGEKLALTAVALAVVLLQFPEDPIAIVAFENEAMILKRADEALSIQELVERFLDVPAQGYTHLEEGLIKALELARKLEKSSVGTTVGLKGRRTATVLLTDGKYTAGRDPAYLAGRFSCLVVLKMGSERASFPLCRELAQKGSGTLREVAKLESLPLVMYGLVKDLLRGKGNL